MTSTLVSLLIGFSSIAAAQGDYHPPFTLAPGSPFAVGGSPLAMVTGDFNSDGIPDLAVQNSGTNAVSIFLGTGTGCFTPVTGGPVSLGGSPFRMFTADYDGDGKLDLIFATSTISNPSVQVLLGDGTGKFSIAPGFPVSAAGPGVMVLGDFNGDGHLDFAFVGTAVKVMLGDGTSNFTIGPDGSVGAGSSPFNSAVADFNGDGRLDIAISNFGSNNITVLLGDGTGGFAPAPGSPFASRQTPYGIAVGDFNGDGIPDLVVSSDQGNQVFVMLGNGKGAFSMAGIVSFNQEGLSPESLAIADFNGDGKLDVVVANLSSSDAIVLAGDGHGGLARAAGALLSTGGLPRALVVADFDSDGKPDIAVTSAASNVVTVFMNSVAPVMLRPSSLNLNVLAGQPPTSVQVFTNAVLGVSVASNQSWLSAIPSPGTNLLLITANPTGLAPGTYQGVLTVTAPGFQDATLKVNFAITGPSGTLLSKAANLRLDFAQPNLVVTADFNGDGIADLSIGFAGSPFVQTFFGNGRGAFSVPASPLAMIGQQGATSLTIGDFNNDGLPDIAVLNGDQVALVTDSASGALLYSGATPVGRSPASSATGDFNGDGNLDLAVANEGSNDVTILLGNGHGQFAPAAGSPFAAGVNPISLAVADFNLDGVSDVAVLNAGSSDITVLLGDGKGGFARAPRGRVTVSLFPFSMTTGDFNGDGFADLAIAGGFGNGSQVTVLLGLGNGAFRAAAGSPFSVEANPLAILAADLNGDGILDLAVASLSGNVTVLIGDGKGGFASSPANVFAAGKGPFSLAVGDFNGDGRPDLAVANRFDGTVTLLLGASTATATTLTSVAAGQSFLLTALVTSVNGAFNLPSGIVTFRDGINVIGTASVLNGSATLALAGSTGTHNFSAAYEGDVRHTPSTSDVVPINR